MNQSTDLKVRFTAPEMALFRRIGAGAYLEENETPLAELAVAHAALSRLLEASAPGLALDAERLDNASAKPWLRELFPASDLTVNGWRAEVRLLFPEEDQFWVDLTFAQSPAHPDLYVALCIASENGGVAVSFLGWVTWEQVTNLPPDDSEGPPVYRVSLTELSFEWDGLLDRLRHEGAAPPVLIPSGSHVEEEEETALVQRIERLLTAPQELPKQEYDHWLACAVCQERAVRTLRHIRDGEKCVVTGQLLLAERQPTLALLRFEEALVLVPGCPEALSGRVHALWQMGRYLAAMEATGEALRAAIDPAPVHRARAALYHLLGRAEDAMEEIRQAIKGQIEVGGSLVAPLLRKMEPMPAWAYVPVVRAGTSPELTVIDAHQPGQTMTFRAEPPELRVSEDGSILALYVHGLPSDLIGRSFRVLILSRSLQAKVEQDLGLAGQAALTALFQPALDLIWRVALMDLALVRDALGLPVEGSVDTGGIIDLWESLPPLPPEALEAKTIIVYVFDPDLGEEGQ